MWQKRQLTSCQGRERIVIRVAKQKPHDPCHQIHTTATERGRWTSAPWPRAGLPAARSCATHRQRMPFHIFEITSEMIWRKHYTMTHEHYLKSDCQRPCPSRADLLHSHPWSRTDCLRLFACCATKLRDHRVQKSKIPSGPLQQKKWADLWTVHSGRGQGALEA